MTKQKEMANEREIVVGISNVNMKIGTNLAAITANAKPCVCVCVVFFGHIQYLMVVFTICHLRNILNT